MTAGAIGIEVVRVVADRADVVPVAAVARDAVAVRAGLICLDIMAMATLHVGHLPAVGVAAIGCRRIPPAANSQRALGRHVVLVRAGYVGPAKVSMKAAASRAAVAMIALHVRAVCVCACAVGRAGMPVPALRVRGNGDRRQLSLIHISEPTRLLS